MTDKILIDRSALQGALEHALAWNEDAHPEPAWASEASAVIAKHGGSACQ